MKFLDEVKIFVKSGDGGNGCVAFRRERNVEFGGPAGVAGPALVDHDDVQAFSVPHGNEPSYTRRRLGTLWPA